MAAIYTVEFQKRGLPHAHIVLFLERRGQAHTPEDINKWISAEIPDKEADPKLYEAVKEYMIHGPCGEYNKKSPCMDGNNCTKHFPKNFSPHTTVDDQGYPVYMRRDNGVTVDKNGIEVHNGFVIPYNRYLLLKYQAHINVEFCNQSKAIKYLFKYINKGNDRISAEISNGDEIKRYIDCRYVSPCEAAWRIFAFDIHYRSVPVERLKFHLEGEESCFFDDDDSIDDILKNNTFVGQSMFLEWMKMNETNAKARTLKYWEFPQYFVWNKDNDRKWTERTKFFSIGRLNYVPVGCGELYYLRVMLNHKRGPKSYADLRTVHGETYPTFKQACYALGLLDDDKEYIDGIKEASDESTAGEMRHLFATILLSNSMSEPKRVWEETWRFLADDILARERHKMKIPDLQLTDEQTKNFALMEIEKLLLDNNSSLQKFPPMPVPDMTSISDSRNRFIVDETNYDRAALMEEHKRLYESLNADQNSV